MNVTDGKYAAKTGAKHTLFGLIGKTRNYLLENSLSGLVQHTASGPMPSGVEKGTVANMTERHLGGKNATKIPGTHHGMVPYPGQFMAKRGPSVS
jgi:hypothetical protein